MFSFFRSLPWTCNLTQNKLTSLSIDKAREILKRNGVVVIPRELILKELNFKISKIEEEFEKTIQKLNINNYLKAYSLEFHSPDSLETHPAILAREGKSFIYTRNGVFFDPYKKINS